jgi:tetratricopeptide (TPR) repeat protein
MMGGPMSAEANDTVRLALAAGPGTDPVAQREMLHEVERRLFGRHAPPPKVGRYDLSHRVGSGGQGVVYVAHDPELDRHVAVKLLLPVRAADEDRQRLLLRTALTVTKDCADASPVPPRLWREAQAMARLSHPNVATVYEVGWHDETAYVAMELIEGVTLRDWLNERRRSVSEILDILIQAGRGLAAAHARDLVHRDFKPHNVMVTREGVAKVLDFGLATQRVRSDGDDTTDGISSPSFQASPLTRTGAIMGTPAYMAPEQRTGGTVDAKSDQFAFCVTAYEALWGHRPFSADAPETAQRALARAPRPRGVPGWLARALHRGLAADPAQRFTTMDELLVALATGATRRRVRIVWTSAAAITVAAVGFGGWTYAERAGALATCAELGDAIHTQVWNDAAKASAHAALLTTGTPHAEAMHGKLEARLDAWTAEWQQARRETCEALQVSETMAPELEIAAHDCLQNRRWALEELLTDLDVATRSESYRLLPAAMKLPDVAACTDETALRSRPAAATDPDERAQIEHLRRKLATVARLEDRGRLSDALALARDVLDEAQEQADAHLHARTLLIVGALEVQTGALAESERTLERALGIAVSAGADALVGEILTELTFAVGHWRGRPADGKRWGMLAQHWLARRGVEGGLEGADLLNYLAVIERDVGDLDAAQVTQERAVAMREAIVGDHFVLAPSLVNLATIQGMRGDYDKAEQATERALAIMQEFLGPEHPDLASALVVLGNLRHLRGRTDEALALFERALRMYEAALGPDHPQVADAVENISIMRVDQGRFAEAEPGFRRALEIRHRVLGKDHPQTVASAADVERIVAMRAAK